jgi:catechol 2,3-dioxygenase-like lactoylglutathione lyase family enzyme
MKFDHVAISVADLYKSIEWYKRNFQAVVEKENTYWAMLKIGDTNLALVANNVHPPHIAFSVDSFNDFPDGVEIKTHHDGSYYLYTDDPDGNSVEMIYWPKK